MPAVLKVVAAITAASGFALALMTLFAAGGFASDVFPPNEGHELRLVPIKHGAAKEPRAVIQPAPGAEIPPEYRIPDPAPSPWAAMPDGSVRFVRGD